ncbi:MAG: photosystem II complex extrinsic protein PsbU [Thermosynechococcaceae cyanobacterium]
MQSFFQRLGVLSFIFAGCLALVGWSQPVHAESLSWQSAQSPMLAVTYRNPVDEKLSTDYGQKLDLNNASVRVFTQYKGMYPTLAGKIVQNAPYSSVKDILNIPDLSDAEKEAINNNIDSFTVTDPSAALVSGGDRYNDGSYNAANK